MANCWEFIFSNSEKIFNSRIFRPMKRVDFNHRKLKIEVRFDPPLTIFINGLMDER